MDKIHSFFISVMMFVSGIFGGGHQIPITQATVEILGTSTIASSTFATTSIKSSLITGNSTTSTGVTKDGDLFNAGPKYGTINAKAKIGNDNPMVVINRDFPNNHFLYKTKDSSKLYFTTTYCESDCDISYLDVKKEKYFNTGFKYAPIITGDLNKKTDPFIITRLMNLPDIRTNRSEYNTEDYLDPNQVIAFNYETGEKITLYTRQGQFTKGETLISECVPYNQIPGVDWQRDDARFGNWHRDIESLGNIKIRVGIYDYSNQGVVECKQPKKYKKIRDEIIDLKKFLHEEPMTYDSETFKKDSTYADDNVVARWNSNPKNGAVLALYDAKTFNEIKQKNGLCTCLADIVETKNYIIGVDSGQILYYKKGSKSIETIPQAVIKVKNGILTETYYKVDIGLGFSAEYSFDEPTKTITVSVFENSEDSGQESAGKSQRERVKLRTEKFTLP